MQTDRDGDGADGRATAGATPLSLLERIRRSPSDESGWDRLFGLYTPLIRACLAGRGVVGPDADDLTQEVCAAVVRDLPGFDHAGRPGAFRRWIRTIAVNRIRRHLRDRARGPGAIAGLDAVEDPDDELARQWDREHDAHVAGRLLERIEPEFSPATWAAFRRQVLDGLSAAEAAAELDTSVNAVLIAKSRVLRRLRQEGRGLLD